MASRNIWVVRAGKGGSAVEDVEKARVVAIGWVEVGDCSGLQTKDDFTRKLRDVYPDSKAIGQSAGQVYRFIRKMEIGETVLTPDSDRREVLVGEVMGEYRYAPELTGGAYPQVRDVKWRGRIPRDGMSPQFRASMGGQTTVFAIEGHEAEIERLLGGEPPPPNDGEETGPTFIAETETKAAELIADHIALLAWEEFELLVAAVLSPDYSRSSRRTGGAAIVRPFSTPETMNSPRRAQSDASGRVIRLPHGPTACERAQSSPGRCFAAGCTRPSSVKLRR